ncbi:MAG: signal peptidase I [Alphaproteobacteria bacterium]|nr:signal peptidase I [Alphaproteobacteria bacterium]
MSSTDLIDEEKPATGMGAWFVEVLRTWMPAILAVLLIRTFIFEPFRIPSGSMIPTLLIGDHVVVNKASYGLWVPYTLVEVPFMESAWIVPRFELLDLGDPARGDIIVFRFPENEALNYIKRVVAIPGDKIQVKNNQIFLNGVAQERKYLDRYESIDDSCNVTSTKRYLENLDGLEHYNLTNAGGGGPLANWPRDGSEFTVPEGNVFVMGDNRDNSEDGRRWGTVRYDQIKGKAHFVWFSWDSCEQKVRANRFFKSLYKLTE